jgi:hypothetical protein
MYEGKKCIVRCNRAGVFFAAVESFDPTTGVADLEDARRLWYWDGAASLSQLAMEGVKKPSACKFTVTVPTMTVLGVIEVIPCTDAAVANIEGVPVWKV